MKYSVSAHQPHGGSFRRLLTTLLLSSLLSVVVFSCSGVYSPRPILTRFEPNITNPSKGEEVYFYVEGTLIDNLPSNRHNYSGELSFSGSGVSGADIEVAGDFSVVAPVTVGEQGEVLVSATLRSADGDEYVSNAVLAVGASRPNEGSVTNPLRLDPVSGFRTTKVGDSSGADSSSYYRFTASATTMVVSLAAPPVDLDLRLFSSHMFSDLFDSDVGGGTPADWAVSGLSIGAIYYLRVDNSSGPDTTFDIKVATP